MSEFPALREALVKAAARRRRRRRRVVVAAPAFAAVAAVAVLVTLAPGEPRERELEAARAPLTRAFSIFARPQTEADRTPDPRLAPLLIGGEYDPALTRLVSEGVYALGRRDGGVCLALPDGEQVGVSCAPWQRAAARDVVSTRTRERRAWLVPDGVHDIRFNFTDGERLSAAAQNNVIVAASPDELLALSWTDAHGVRHIERPGTIRFAATRRCTGSFPFDPPPAGAERLAARAALIDALYFDSTATTATVLDTEAAPPTACSDEVNQRLVQVRLQFDSSRRQVFVGWVKGRPQTFVLPVR